MPQTDDGSRRARRSAIRPSAPRRLSVRITTAEAMIHTTKPMLRLVSGFRPPAVSGSRIAPVTATANAHFRRCAIAGSSALRHRAIGPTPIRKSAGAISG